MQKEAAYRQAQSAILKLWRRRSLPIPREANGNGISSA